MPINIINNKILIILNFPVFALVTVIFILCMLTTISSFREIPLKLLESDEMLRPLTQISVKKEKEKLKAMESGKFQLQQAPITAMVVSEKLKSNGVTNGDVKNYTETVVKSSSSSISSSDDDDDENEESSVTFVRFLITFLAYSCLIKIYISDDVHKVNHFHAKIIKNFMHHELPGLDGTHCVLSVFHRFCWRSCLWWRSIG